MSNHYFFEVFLQKSKNGLFEITSYSPPIMLSFTIITLFSVASFFYGVFFSKYIVYFSVLIPYVLIFVLFAKGITLEGHDIGWAYLFSSDWSRILTVQIWVDAASQVLFSAGLAQNTIVKFASGRNERDSILVSTWLIPLLNFIASIFGAFTLFAFMGCSSFETGIHINEMPVHGMELAFVIYSNLLSILPYPKLVSCLFFLTLTCLGLGSLYLLIETISSLLYGT